MYHRYVGPPVSLRFNHTLVNSSIPDYAWCLSRRHYVTHRFPNPSLKIVQSLSYPGFTFRILIPNSNNLPEPGSTIYVEWNESNSNEPAGWYRCEVVAYSPNGAAQLFYPAGAAEVVDLSTIKWNFACRSSKKYRNLDSQPPLHPHLSEKEQCSKAREINRTQSEGIC